MIVMHENRKRSLAKTITYRAMATTILAIITWFYTKELFITSEITVMFTIFATIAFYINERVWNRTNWGKEPRRSRRVLRSI